MDERRALPRVPEAFAATTGLVVDRWTAAAPVGASRADVLLYAGGEQFVVEYQSRGDATRVGNALRQLEAALRALGPGWRPLVVVPYMGEVGQALCRAAGVSWMDLSGNAEIRAPGLNIRLLGGANRFKERGRPSDLFSPGAACLARALLLEPSRSFSQSDLAQVTGLTPGYISKLVPSYEEAGFLERHLTHRRASIRATRPDLLLAAWRTTYSFAEHDIRRGHMASRSGVELARLLASRLAQLPLNYAATGLTAAWFLAPFANFRLVTVYVDTWPGAEELRSLGFYEEARGSNVWLVRPTNPGVFAGAAVADGIRCVSPVQVYLDLASQPERAEEASAELRRVLLSDLDRAADAETGRE